MCKHDGAYQIWESIILRPAVQVWRNTRKHLQSVTHGTVDKCPITLRLAIEARLSFSAYPLVSRNISVYSVRFYRSSFFTILIILLLLLLLCRYLDGNSPPCEELSPERLRNSPYSPLCRDNFLANDGAVCRVPNSATAVDLAMYCECKHCIIQIWYLQWVCDVTT